MGQCLAQTTCLPLVSGYRTRSTATLKCLSGYRLLLKSPAPSIFLGPKDLYALERETDRCASSLLLSICASISIVASLSRFLLLFDQALSTESAEPLRCDQYRMLQDLLYRRMRCLANYESANKNLERARGRNKDIPKVQHFPFGFFYMNYSG